MPKTPAIPHYETVDRAGNDASWITMVHGMSQNTAAFSAQIDTFSPDYRLLLIDLPGHGGSASMPGPYGMTEFAAAIEAALNHTGIGRTHYWGTHIGAASGLLLASGKPALFHSLILEGPVYPGRAMLSAVSDVIAEVAATAKSKGLDEAKTLWWEGGGWFDVMRARPQECRAAEQRAMIEDFEGAPWLDSQLVAAIPPVDDLFAQLTVPVLIMNGEHDIPEFLEAAEALASILPNSRQHRVRDGGGFPFWEFPDRVNAEVRRFLESLS